MSSRRLKELLLKGAGLGALSYASYKLLDDRFLISEDLFKVIQMGRMLFDLKYHSRNQNTMADIWEASADEFADRDFFDFCLSAEKENVRWTYRNVDLVANQVARFFKSAGVKRGVVVALVMDNRPEFFVIWLAVAKCGGTTALINHNLKDRPLQHSIAISHAKILVVQKAFEAEVASIHQGLQASLKNLSTFVMGHVVIEPSAAARGGGANVVLPSASSLGPHLEPLFASLPTARLVKADQRGDCQFSDSALLVYTSGTTGLPKAATIKHARLFSMGSLFNRLFALKQERIYTCLPLYHSAGGCVGIVLTMLTGSTMILKNKFSASQFWSDCATHKATAFQYIGELCRYLLQCPPSAWDRKHAVRIGFGNGLRPDIWKRFQERFGLKEIGEFYGSTEGVGALFNHCVDEDSVGALSRTGTLFNYFAGMYLVRFDVEKEEPIRGTDGKCIECQPGEVGELVGRIIEGDPIRSFGGYHGNEKATKGKILTSVFKDGDQFFRTGDLLRRDKSGYWYFVDRIGDTFRWKGENVSTNEVAEVLSLYPGVQEVNVYGVEVPHTDGRACMVGMVINLKGQNASRDGNMTSFLKGFYNHAAAKLPGYAVPVFIRQLKEVAVTSTFKHQKVQLRKEGARLDKVAGDALFVLDMAQKTYVPLSKEKWDDLAIGNAKL